MKIFQTYTKYFFLASFLILAYLSFFMLKPFFNPIIAGLFLAYIFYPLHLLIKKVVKHDDLSSAISLLAVVVAIVLPLAVLIDLLIDEALIFYHRIDIQLVIDFVDKYFGGSFSIYADQILAKSLSYISRLASDLVLSLPQKGIALIVILFTLFFSFKQGEKIVGAIYEILPVEVHYKKKIFEQSKNLLDALMYGSIVVAVVQGAAAALGFFLLGVKAPALLGLLVAVFAILPVVGPATVWVPLSLFKLLTGQTWQAFGIALYGLIVLTIILDTIWKHKLIGEKAKVHPLITLLGVLGGLKFFGLMGLITGPLVLVFFILCIKYFGGKFYETKS
ncbi:AI-2E family transporter [Candidatus Woesearchaeota archaeon]|nr:AI-2E family transporter [Candidatus Woesearchaeota archaeon]